MKLKWTILIVIGFTACILFSSLSVNAASTETVTVSFIDVGQGDSVLIRDGNGFDVLIDGGVSKADSPVVAYLREQGVDDIEVMVATHAHSDHIGGLIDVLELDDIPVESVFYNGYPGDTTTWSNFITAVTNEGLTLTSAQYPQSFTWGATSVHILNPISGLANPEQNDASVVILLDHGDIEILFTGDIGTSVESDILSRGSNIAAEILKVSHHGSKYASSAGFLAEVQPEEAVISVGSNPYGHPHPETIARLLAIGARIWRTDVSCTVVVNSDGSTYSVVPDCQSLFLPVVLNNFPSSPPDTTGNMVIIDIYYDGEGSQEPDEYVEIRNDDTKSIQLQNWTLRDITDHIYTFPSFVIEPDDVCRVYTNENHPVWCGFNYGSGSAIWNNGGDCAYLLNSQINLVDEYCY